MDSLIHEDTYEGVGLDIVVPEISKIFRQYGFCVVAAIQAGLPLNLNLGSPLHGCLRIHEGLSLDQHCLMRDWSDDIMRMSRVGYHFAIISTTVHMSTSDSYEYWLHCGSTSRESSPMVSIDWTNQLSIVKANQVETHLIVLEAALGELIGSENFRIIVQRKSGRNSESSNSTSDKYATRILNARVIASTRPAQSRIDRSSDSPMNSARQVSAIRKRRPGQMHRSMQPSLPKDVSDGTMEHCVQLRQRKRSNRLPPLASDMNLDFNAQFAARLSNHSTVFGMFEQMSTSNLKGPFIKQRSSPIRHDFEGPAAATLRKYSSQAFNLTQGIFTQFSPLDGNVLEEHAASDDPVNESETGVTTISARTPEDASPWSEIDGLPPPYALSPGTCYNARVEAAWCAK